MTHVILYVCHVVLYNMQGRIQNFFRRGCTRLLLFFNTNNPQSFFFWQNTSCIRTPQVILGEVCTPCTLHLDPPLTCVMLCYITCVMLCYITYNMLYNKCHVMLYNRWHVMLCYITYVMLC